MKKIIIPIVVVIAVLFGAKFFLFRGGPPPGARGNMPPPTVDIAEVSEIEVNETIETTGRVEAPEIVDITARVEGYLKKAYFKEGSYVKKGDLLFLIEPDRYEILVQQASAGIEEAKAALKEAEKNFVRIRDLVEKDYASKSQFDDIQAKRDRAKALLSVKNANYNNAKLNLSYTRIYAPITGKIGRINIDEGNLVVPAVSQLARIVSLDPVYVNYSIRSDEYLNIKTFNKGGDVEIKLPDGTTYPTKGQVVFFDNEVDAATGTIDVRAEFKNPDSILIPGQYVNTLMYLGKAEKTLAVAQEAVMESPQGKMVYVVDKENTANIRPIEVDKQYKGYWTLKSGLEQGERVVVKGIQKLRPGIKLQEQGQENAKK